jgi:hypothetical protein
VWVTLGLFFRKLKGFRRIFSRFEKLDALFLGSSHSRLSPKP